METGTERMNLTDGVECLLSPIVLLTAIVAVVRSRQQTPARSAVQGLTQRIDGVRGRLLQIGPYEPSTHGGSAVVTPTAVRTHMNTTALQKTFLDWLQDWFDAARQLRDPDIWSGHIEKFLLKSAPFNETLKAGQPLEESTLKDFRRAASEALRCSDTDLDPDRKDERLQSLLQSVVRGAKLELIDPPRDTLYSPSAASRMQSVSTAVDSQPEAIRVGAVLTRGLRTPDGKVIFAPEIREAP